MFTGDRGQAQDLAQETLLRAWQRWEKVSAYEDPAAWCRRVLSNLATSEWRKSSRRRAVLPSTLIAPEPDVEALNWLVPSTRCHHLSERPSSFTMPATFPLPMWCVSLDVPEGTVRSWLSRGRKALAAELYLSDSDDEVQQDDPVH